MEEIRRRRSWSKTCCGAALVFSNTMCTVKTKNVKLKCFAKLWILPLKG
uniref:Uncharacterized protein n=1 Tax=Anguilla anguilla TaxID=7936 RepID=A0A0E9WMQ8_ANGAN